MQKKTDIGLHLLRLLIVMIFISTLVGCLEQEDVEQPPTELLAQMSPDDVSALLGPSSGHMTVNGETTRLYGGIALKFVDNKLILPAEDLLARANQRILARMVEPPKPKNKWEEIWFMVKEKIPMLDKKPPAKTVKKEAAPAPETVVDEELPPTKPMQPALATQGKRAMYDAARSSYIRACEAAGDSPDDFPSFEDWSAEN